MTLDPRVHGTRKQTRGCPDVLPMEGGASVNEGDYDHLGTLTP